MGYRETETAVLLADFGVVVKWKRRTTKGLLDFPGSIETDRAGQSFRKEGQTLLVRASEFTALALEENLTADGTTYRVRDKETQDDGVFLLISLAPT